MAFISALDLTLASSCSAMIVASASATWAELDD
jgi:hypothetical protein